MNYNIIKNYYKKFFKFLYSLIIILLIFANCKQSSQTNRNQNSTNLPNNKSLRVISLAPNITETICALNADTLLCGVTEYCNYPLEKTKQIAKIGGFTNLNYEMIFSLKPDMAILLPLHRKELDSFKKLNINCQILSFDNITDIKNSIIYLGNLFNHQTIAKEIVQNIDNSLMQIQNLQTKVKDKKILIIVSRAPKSLASIFAATQKTFYFDIANRFGLKNALPDANADYVMINSESIAAANPDIILEIYAPNNGMTLNTDISELKKDWAILKNVNAVKNNKIFFIIADYAVIPGPRIVNLINDFKKILENI